MSLTNQNATRAPKRKSQALKIGSNKMADVRLAVRVRGKIGDKCLVMRSRFAVMGVILVLNGILNKRIESKDVCFSALIDAAENGLRSLLQLKIMRAVPLQ